MDVCLRGLKETTKVGSTATVSRTSVLITSHITFRDCRVHSFCDNLSRNSCIHLGADVTDNGEGNENVTEIVNPRCFKLFGVGF